MKQLTLRVDAQKYDSLLEALKGFDVEVIEEKPKKARKESSAEARLTPGQKKTWAGIKQALGEAKLAEQGKLKLQTFDEFMEELRAEDLA